MALIVEDGSGLSNANSYISVADADAYHEARGNTVWESIDDEVKEQLLVKAADYIELTYFANWLGLKAYTGQALAFPRRDVYGRLIVYQPTLARANAELALIAYTTPLMPNITRGKRRVKVGPVEVEYDANSPMQTKFVQASLLIAPLLDGYRAGGAMGRLERR